MEIIKAKRLLTFIYSPKSLKSYELYFITITFVILFWLLKFVWKRRKLYVSASKLPGPYGLPIIGSAHKFMGHASDVYKCIDELFCEYQSAGLFKLWFGTKLLYCTTDAKVFDIVLTSPCALRKEPLYNLGDKLFGAGLFSQKSVPKWRRNRKLVTPAFNQQMLNSFMEVFVQRSEELVEFMEHFEGKKDVDLYDLLSRYALKTICDTAMGINMDTESEGADFNHWVERALEITMERIFNIYYHSDLIFFNMPLGREFKELCNKARSFTRQVIIKKRRQMEEEKRNKAVYYEAEGRKRLTYMDILLKVTYEDDKSYFTDEEIIDEIITLLAAGSDTTSTTNTFALLLLGMHQDIQEKVLTEILEVVGPERSVCVDDLPHLKYLERVIKESLRLFPVGPFLARTLDGDVDVGNHVLSKGGSVFFAVLRVHRNEKFWANALKFDPDRFLPENVTKITPGSYIPFSHGPRNCLGLRYAMMTMKVILATILRKYKIFTDYKSIEEIDIKCSIMTRPINGYKLHYELRK